MLDYSRREGLQNVLIRKKGYDGSSLAESTCKVDRYCNISLKRANNQKILMTKQIVVSFELYHLDDRFAMTRITLQCGHVICRGEHHVIQPEYECGQCRDEEYRRSDLRLNPNDRARCGKPFAACRLGCCNG